ncbi:hypothetical protein [Deinococcus cellulosilyticus]|uniref:Uncharacterized protein n=1 Tax=Deinococcus cellulosilyticus (strain DSM 18568 / NBRC 106333 / KACC 11606 / 5516J-15) TaxID=1223518 RepID=A0A511MX13_DEIC1|nr:hypothetical protein [Deinococcus cellulosilyticus]GEM45122.1 hypothetical protein DC3_07570 [Deinococcus cellulosilyticus NBRC 106333 = KACC 11606]
MTEVLKETPAIRTVSGDFQPLWRFSGSSRQFRLHANYLQTLHEFQALAGRQPAVPSPINWQTQVRELLELVMQAMQHRALDLGWRLLKTAQRYLVYGFTQEEIQIKAAEVLREISDPKINSPWRKDAARSILTDCDQLRENISPQALAEVMQLLHDYQNSVYHVLHLQNRRLQLLSLYTTGAVLAWVLLGPDIKAFTTSQVYPLTQPKLQWLIVLLLSWIGAAISGFVSSFKQVRSNTIPSEISEYTLTFARFALAGLSSIALFTVLGAGIIDQSKLTYDVLLALALVSGFSERLVTRAVEIFMERTVPLQNAQQVKEIKVKP